MSDATAIGGKRETLTRWFAPAVALRRSPPLAATRRLALPARRWVVAALRRRAALALRRCLALVLIGAAATSAWAQQHQHGAGTAAGATATAGTTPAAPAPGANDTRGAGASAPLFTQADLMFLTHMIVHHEQALEMAAMVPSRTNREEFIRFARYLDGAQRSEIDQMKGLLRLAADRGLEIPHHEMTGDPPMTGMLSKAQMAALAAASGEQFEKLWMQGMIYHHQGALDMAREMQERQFQSGRQTFGLDVIVDDITEVQRAEINKMKMWLVQWGLS